MGKLHCTIRDEISQEQIEARVHVVSSNGSFHSPPNSLLKVGPGVPLFYTSGEFELNLPSGQADVIVERGTEYKPLRHVVQAPVHGMVNADLTLTRWTDLPRQGWHPGNTHLHYSEKENRPDDRLRMDPRVNDLRVTIISILQRRELPYASNKYPVGMMTEFCTAHHTVDCGEESRHNSQPWDIGYGHIMLIRLRNMVDPVSRGMLVDDFDPDYPPLCYACDDARRQGGIVIWCHNGKGMEAPVAAALGKLDAFNLFDPYWMDPEYDIWYQMLNCGMKLPASTGTDWFLCSDNRVYVQSGADFSYDAWIENLKKGRTFITNGPALRLRVNDKEPGDCTQIENEGVLEATVTLQSHYPVNRVEVIRNGQIVGGEEFPEGARSAELSVAVPVSSNGWIAARCSGAARNSFDHGIYAHTSPVYVDMSRPSKEGRESAARLMECISNSLEWVETKGRFYKDSQRREVRDLFLEARGIYENIARR